MEKDVREIMENAISEIEEIVNNKKVNSGSLANQMINIARSKYRDLLKPIFEVMASGKCDSCRIYNASIDELKFLADNGFKISSAPSNDSWIISWSMTEGEEDIIVLKSCLKPADSLCKIFTNKDLADFYDLDSVKLKLLNAINDIETTHPSMAFSVTATVPHRYLEDVTKYAKTLGDYTVYINLARDTVSISNYKDPNKDIMI